MWFKFYFLDWLLLFYYFRFAMPPLLQEIASAHTSPAMRTKSPAKFVASFSELPTWRTTWRNTLKELTTTVEFATKVCFFLLNSHHTISHSQKRSIDTKVFSRRGNKPALTWRWYLAKFATYFWGIWLALIIFFLVFESEMMSTPMGY